MHASYAALLMRSLGYAPVVLSLCSIMLTSVTYHISKLEATSQLLLVSLYSVLPTVQDVSICL